MAPLVSILLPCYNAEKFLDYAMESILNQTHKNLQIICINDGSTDKTLEILKAYQKKDARIIIINNETNLGLIDSLNSSFAYIKGDYFARMDSDDFSVPERISTQLAFITNNKQYDLFSSSYFYFEEDNKKLEYIPAVGSLPNSLKFISMLSTPFTHGAVFGKTSLITSGKFYYDKNYLHSEDFELFSRLSWQNVPMANITQPLYWLRLSPSSVSAIHTDKQIKTHTRITRRNLIENLGVTDGPDETILRILCNRIIDGVTLNDVKTAIALLQKYSALADKKLRFTPAEKKEIKRYLDIHTLNIILQSNKMGFKARKQKNLGFFLGSAFLLKPKQIPLLLKKIAAFLFY